MHQHSRRQGLALIAALASTLALPASAQGTWPQGQIKIITPSPVGVGTDAFARMYAERLGKALKTSVFVENKPGAAGTLGADAVAKSAPNGYTLLLTTSLPITTAPALFSKLPYAPNKDLVPVAQLYRGGSFLIAGPAFKGKTLQDLVALAKRDANAVTYASYGPGSTAHLGMELFQDAASIEMVHVPYRQSAMPDLIGGQVMIGWEPPISALPNIASGKVRALAYTGDRRSPALPDVPTLAESFPGLDVFTWVGVWAPAGTPEAVVTQLHAALNAITQQVDLGKALHDAGAETMTTNRTQMASGIERETQMMGRLIKAKQITLN